MEINKATAVPRLKQIAASPLKLKNWYSELFPADFTMEYHAHPQIELMYCQHGAFDFVYKAHRDAMDTKTVTVCSNSFILVNTGYYHKIANLQPSSRIVNLEYLPAEKDDGAVRPLRQLQLSPATLGLACPKLQKLLSKDRDFYLFVDSNNVLHTMLEIIHKTTGPESPEQTLAIRLLTAKLFMDISHCTSPENHIKTGIVYVDAAMMYINSHFMNKLTVEDIAAATGVSKVYLQRLFKSEYGKTVHEVLQEKRLAQARHLLEQTSLSITEIAGQCGFGCREQLTGVFKKCEGISPLDYRRQLSRERIRHFSNLGEDKILTPELLR